MDAKVYQENIRLGENQELTPMWVVEIDGKRKPCIHYTEGQAYVYAGLLLEGLSLNDANYLSRCLNTMLDGLKA